MKKNKNIVFTFLAVVLVQFVALSQVQDPPPTDPADFGGLGSQNATDTPIDAYVLLLLVVGLVYVFYKYRGLKLKESKVS